MTADLDGQQLPEIMDVGANALLEKPLRRDKLLHCLEQQIEATPQRSFPRIEGIDRDYAIRAMGHDAALFIRLTEVLLRDNQNTTTKIKAHINDNERPQAIDQLRRSRAGASRLGALALKSTAEQMQILVQINDSIEA